MATFLCTFSDDDIFADPPLPYLHRKKRFTSFPSPAGMSLTKLPFGRNNSVMTSLFPPRESLVVTSRLGTGNSRTFFLRCTPPLELRHQSPGKTSEIQLPELSYIAPLSQSLSITEHYTLDNFYNPAIHQKLSNLATGKTIWFNPWTWHWIKAQVKYGGRSPKFIWAPCHVMCTAALIG